MCVVCVYVGRTRGGARGEGRGRNREEREGGGGGVEGDPKGHQIFDLTRNGDLSFKGRKKTKDPSKEGRVRLGTEKRSPTSKP